MSFRYRARDPLGTVHEGSIEADSREQAAQALLHDGLQVIKLEQADGGLNLLPRRIKKSEIIYTTGQLAIMVDTGINLSAALEGICRQCENPALRKVLSDLKSHVEAGEDFSTALARHPKHFNKTFVSLVKASEQTGTLGEMLDQIAGYLRSELDNRAKVRAALAYPSVMVFLAIVVTVFLLTYVLPKFDPLFNRQGIQLPASTVVMLTVSRLLIDYWYIWLAVAASLVTGFLIGRRTQPGRSLLDWAKIHMPILGPVFRKVTISRSLRTLGVMVQNGVSVLDAIRLSSEVSGNYHYEQAWLHVLDEITTGNRISDALKDSPLFPGTLIQMIGAGEETGKLDYVLAKVSAYYDQEVETSLKAATSLIEPMMITVMGVVVGGIGMSIMLPIFQLSRTPT